MYEDNRFNNGDNSDSGSSYNVVSEPAYNPRNAYEQPMQNQFVYQPQQPADYSRFAGQPQQTEEPQFAGQPQQVEQPQFVGQQQQIEQPQFAGQPQQAEQITQLGQDLYDSPIQQVDQNQEEQSQQPEIERVNQPVYSNADVKQDRKAEKRETKKKKKENRSTFGKGVRFAFSALAFGVIAGAVIYGVCYLGNIALPIAATQQQTVALPLAPTTNSGTSGVSNVSNNITPSIVDGNNLTVKDIVNANMPAMVIIKGKVTSGAYQSAASGTGIIIGQSDKELFIVTNAHVVDGVSDLQAIFDDGSAADITIKGSKSDKDIAVVSVDSTLLSQSTLKAISVADIGDSSTVVPGDQVVAIGNANGEGQSVTVGWISALDRSITISGKTFTGLFMTDAAINPGNSGGALLNMSGQVIGINSAKNVSSNVEGMGYAIPISSVQDIIDKLVSKQNRDTLADDPGYLGITCMDVTSSISSYYGYPQGVFIKDTVAGSPAEKGGLSYSDIIVEFDDNKTVTYKDLTNTLKYYKVGETVTVGYYHYENSHYVYKTTQVTLGKSN